GNIRELENEIERLIVLGGDLGDLPSELLSQRVRDGDGVTRPQALARSVSPGTLKDAVETLERDLIHHGLIRTHWNKSQLAKELGISRSNLIAKVERYGLERKDHHEAGRSSGQMFRDPVFESVSASDKSGSRGGSAE